LKGGFKMDNNIKEVVEQFDVAKEILISSPEVPYEDIRNFKCIGSIDNKDRVFVMEDGLQLTKDQLIKELLKYKDQIIKIY
jgi:hypothetical protein